MNRLALLLLLLIPYAEASAQFTFSNGPAGGVTVYDAIEHDGVWYAAAGEALLRSEDERATWQLVTEGLPQIDIAPRSFASLDGHLYMSTNSQSRMLRSADGGYSWELFNNNLPALFGLPTYMAVKMIVNNERLIALPHGAAAIAYLDKGDAQWNLTEFSGTVGNGLRAIGGDTLLASISSEHRMSTDNGTTWQPFPANPPVSVGAVGATDFLRSGGVVIATTAAGGLSTTFYSEDNLASWQQSNPGFRTGNAGGDRLLKVSDQLILAAADSGIVHSTDHGRSWTTVNRPADRINGNTLFVKRVDGDRLLVGSGNDAYYFDDLGAGARTRLHLPISQVDMNDGLVEFRGSLYALHGSLISRYSPDGPAWEVVADVGFNQRPDALFALGDQLAYASDAGLFVSQNLSDFEPVIPPEGVEPVSIHALGDQWYLVGGTRVIQPWGIYWSGATLHRSDDEGASWTEVSTTLPTDQLSGPPLFKGYDLIEHDGALFLYGEPGYLMSTDGGNTWSKAGERRTRIISFDGALFQVSSDDFKHRITRSLDGGDTWTEYLDGFPESNSFSREPKGMARSGDKLYAYNAPMDPKFNPGETGVFVLESASSAWSQVTDEPHLPKEPMGLFAHDGLLFAGIHSIGLYQMRVGESTTSTEIASDLPSTIQLDQNYPNPFNPATLVRYSLNRESHVRLQVFDLQGRHVSTLVDGPRSVGTHELQFDASGLPSGTYLYRLDAGGVVQSRRMIVVK